MNEELTVEEICEDDAEDMADRGHIRGKNSGFADIASFQAVICLLAAIGILILLRFAPDLSEELLERISTLSKEKNDIFPNPLMYFVK